MSVTVVSGGRNGKLYGLLWSLNDLGVVGGTTVPPRGFNVIKMLFDTTTHLGELEIRLQINESLYVKLIRYVPLEQWEELENDTILGRLVRVRVTSDSNANEIRSIIDSWVESLFVMPLTQVVKLKLKVHAQPRTRRSLPQPRPSRISNSLVQ
jgi:hypothetical protein